MKEVFLILLTVFLVLLTVFLVLLTTVLLSCGQSQKEIEEALARVETVYIQLQDKQYTLLFNPWAETKDSLLVTRKLTSYDSSVIEQYACYIDGKNKNKELYGIWQAQCVDNTCPSNADNLPSYIVPAPARTKIAFELGWEEQYCCWCKKLRILEYKKDVTNSFYWFPFVQYKTSLEKIWKDYVLGADLDKSNPIN